jgi:hypothetical protein
MIIIIIIRRDTTDGTPSAPLKAIAVSDSSIVVCVASHDGMMPPHQKTRNESAESVLPEPAGVIPRDELAEVPYRL